MKKLFYLCFISIFSLALTGCGEEDKNASGKESEESTESGAGKESKSNTAISSWERHVARTEPGRNKGEWVATLLFGEEVEWLGDSVYDEASKRSYVKVKLSNDKTGWVDYNLVIRGGELAAISSQTPIYDRPSAASISDKSFEAGELAVVIRKKDEMWTEVVGKNDANYKRKKGWLMGNGLLNTDESDLQLAILLSKAESETNPIKKKEKFEQLLSNPSFAGSSFYNLAEEKAKMADPESSLKDDELLITGSTVNVRSKPEIEEGNVVFQVKAGDVCKVNKRGDMDEINGNTDYWYKIEKGGQSGWIFGSNTNRSLSEE